MVLRSNNDPVGHYNLGTAANLHRQVNLFIKARLTPLLRGVQKEA